jgi:hypothetical protein
LVLECGWRSLSCERPSVASCYDRPPRPERSRAPRVVTRWPRLRPRWHEDARDVPVVPRRGPGRRLPPLGLAAGLLAKSGVVQLGRDAWRSSANVRRPPPRQVHMAQPFVLDGPPGAPRTIALGINDQGQVVGTYENTAAAPPSPQPTSTPPTGRMSEHRWPPDRARPELARSGARSTRPARLLPILAGKPSAG